MKIKTADLIGDPLDWAVAKIEGKYLVYFDEYFTRNGIASGKSPNRVQSMLDFQPLKGKWCWLNSLGGGVAIPEYSTDWSQGGPIIEREKITVCWEGTTWVGSLYLDHDRRWGGNKVGPTPLIAAMRCYCYAKLGEFVDIPEELCQQQKT